MLSKKRASLEEHLTQAKTESLKPNGKQKEETGKKLLPGNINAAGRLIMVA